MFNCSPTSSISPRCPPRLLFRYCEGCKQGFLLQKGRLQGKGNVEPDEKDMRQKACLGLRRWESAPFGSPTMWPLVEKSSAASSGLEGCLSR